MKQGSLVVQRLSGCLAETGLSGAKHHEVFAGPGRHIVKYLHHHSSRRLPINGYVEKAATSVASRAFLNHLNSQSNQCGGKIEQKYSEQNNNE
jgi:hypothetical protein